MMFDFLIIILMCLLLLYIGSKTLNSWYDEVSNTADVLEAVFKRSELNVKRY